MRQISAKLRKRFKNIQDQQIIDIKDLYAAKKKSEEDIKSRLLRAQKELEYSKYFKYIIVNDDLESAINKLDNLVNKEK